MAEQEFEALKERVSGLRKGFRKVSCINATLPMSVLSSVSDELCSACKVSFCLVFAPVAYQYFLYIMFGFVLCCVASARQLI